MSLAGHIAFGLISAVLALLVCRNADALGRRLRIMDRPGERKIHREPTPLMGGMALMAGFVPLVIVAGLTGFTGAFRFEAIFLGLCTWAMVLVGLIDDRHGLSPRIRLVASFLVYATATLYPAFNVRLLDFEHPAFQIGLAFGWLALLFTTLCLVGLLNAINMADGKNGLVLGLCLGWTGLLATRAPPWLHVPLLCLAAVLAVLFVFNLRGKLFLGDGGAYGVATAIGVMAIATYNYGGSHALRSISAEEVVALFAVPVLDSFRLAYVRVRNGRSPMSPDRDHLHHHLMDRFGWPGGLYLYWLIALVPAAVVFAFG